MEVNSEGTAVRRSTDNPPPDIFSPEQRKKMKEKTVYVVRKEGCGLGQVGVVSVVTVGMYPCRKDLMRQSIWTISNPLWTSMAR